MAAGLYRAFTIGWVSIEAPERILGAPRKEDGMRRIIVMGMAALAIVAAVPSAMAESGPGGGGAEVRRKGSCSANSDWELRIEDRGSTFRVRFDVDSGITGQTWNLSVSRNGAVIASDSRVTNGSGEAEFRLRGVPDNAGTDTFSGSATNPATGETCSATASIG